MVIYTFHIMLKGLELRGSVHCVNKLIYIIFWVKNVKPQIEKAIGLFAHDDYSSLTAVDNVTAMCDRVREEMKRFNYKRYRYIVSG